MNGMVEKHGLINKRTQIIPEVVTFPKLDKVSFRLPSLPDHQLPSPKLKKPFDHHDLESDTIKR
jgi:hypothetical protein